MSQHGGIKHEGEREVVCGTGRCAGAVLTLAFYSFSLLGVQSQKDSFGEITCTGHVLLVHMGIKG